MYERVPMHARRSEDSMFWKSVLNTPFHPVVEAVSLGILQASWPESLFSRLSLSSCLREASVTDVAASAFCLGLGGCLQVVRLAHHTPVILLSPKLHILKLWFSYSYFCR